MKIETKIESFKSMMHSCYTYGGIERNGNNFERFLTPYEQRLGSDLFNKIYEEHSKYLRDNYKVVLNVYTDFEGLVYNQLKLKP